MPEIRAKLSHAVKLILLKCGVAFSDFKSSCIRDGGNDSRQFCGIYLAVLVNLFRNKLFEQLQYLTYTYNIRFEKVPSK